MYNNHLPQIEVERFFGRKFVFVVVKKRPKEAIFNRYKNYFVTKNVQRKAELGT
jgi:hypothetical protein